jgi:2-C-methyl-D-erythritol 2,4-cyclodiphosphate synthase
VARMPELDGVVPRSGIGFDVHAFAAARPLWLGCVRFDGEPGLAGHSDGDVLAHAVADALLGAATLGDVGEHFRDTDPATAGLEGAEMLRRTADLVREAGHEPDSVDATLVCDRPAIAPRRDEIRGAVAAALRLDPGRVSVKATRPEGLGLTGDGIGCLAIAVVV